MLRTFFYCCLLTSFAILYYIAGWLATRSYLRRKTKETGFRRRYEAISGMENILYGLVEFMPVYTDVENENE